MERGGKNVPSMSANVQGYNTAAGEIAELQVALLKKRRAVSSATRTAITALNSSLTRQVSWPK